MRCTPGLEVRNKGVAIIASLAKAVLAQHMSGNLRSPFFSKKAVHQQGDQREIPP